MRKAVIGASVAGMLVIGGAVAGMLVIGGAVYRVYLVPADQPPTTEPQDPRPSQEPRPTEPPADPSPGDPTPSPGEPTPRPTERPPSSPPPGGKVGYGAVVTGGTGGETITLGPGSTEADYRAAMVKTTPRVVTCAAGMLPPVYLLTQPVYVRTAAMSDITVDGEPCGGITAIKKPNAGGLIFNGVSFRNGVGNIWIRYARFVGDYLPGLLPTPHINDSSALEFDGDGPESARIVGVYLEHVAVTRGVDSGPDVYGRVEKLTYIDCFFYENLHPTTDSDSNGQQPRSEHSYIRILWALNGERNPQLRRDVRLVDYANNVVYGWCATYFSLGAPPQGPGSYGVKVEDEAAAGKNPRDVVFRGNAFVAGPCSVYVTPAQTVDHRGWDLIYGTKAGCDAGGAPADPHDCNPRLSVGALRADDNLFTPQHSKYDGFTTNKGKTLPLPSYPLTVLSSRDLESVILGAGIPEADTPREAQLRAEALAAYRARVGQ